MDEDKKDKPVNKKILKPTKKSSAKAIQVSLEDSESVDDYDDDDLLEIDEEFSIAMKQEVESWMNKHGIVIVHNWCDKKATKSSGGRMRLQNSSPQIQTAITAKDEKVILEKGVSTGPGIITNGLKDFQPVEKLLDSGSQKGIVMAQMGKKNTNKRKRGM